MARPRISWSLQRRPTTTSPAAPAVPMAALTWPPWAGSLPRSRHFLPPEPVRTVMSILTRTTAAPTTICTIPPTTTSDVRIVLNPIITTPTSRGLPTRCGLRPSNRSVALRLYLKRVSLLSKLQVPKVHQPVFGAIPLFSGQKFFLLVLHVSILHGGTRGLQGLPYTPHPVLFWDFICYLSLGRYFLCHSTLICDFFLGGWHTFVKQRFHFGWVGVGRALERPERASTARRAWLVFPFLSKALSLRLV